MTLRKEVCDIISEMLDNPDEYGIYSTAKAFKDLIKLVRQKQVETIGWTYAQACHSLDNDIDPRKISPDSWLEQAKKDLYDSDDVYESETNKK